MALLILAGCEPAQPVANVEPGTKKVAVFEGGEVTLAEVQEFAEQSGLGELSPDSPQYEAAIAQIMPQLVQIEVVKAYAREHGITVSEGEVDKEIDEYVARTKLDTLGVEPEELTQEQISYMSSWR